MARTKTAGNRPPHESAPRPRPGQLPNATQPAPPGPASFPRTGAVRARRQPKWIAAGLLAVCLGALVSVLLYGRIAGSDSVIAVSANVARGETIEASDLTVVQIGATPGVRTVPASQLTKLVGQQALVDLVGGSLLPAGAVGTVTLPHGWVQIGLSLKAGALPVQPIAPGTAIQLVAIAADTGGGDNLTGKVFDAFVVTAPVDSPDGQTKVLDVRVTESNAPAVAQLAAADRIVLYRKAS